MEMKNPAHPGEILREEVLVPHGLSVSAGAKLLGVSRQTLNNIVNTKSAISAEMAIRIEKVFGGSAGLWTRMQAAYDLAQARMREDEIKVEQFEAV